MELAADGEYLSKDSTIKIEVKKDKDHACSSAQNHGIGISDKKQKQIFERFFRANSTRTLSYSGFGLGLYIVAEIAKKMNGTIDFKSSENQDSTFTLTLPLIDKDVDE